MEKQSVKEIEQEMKEIQSTLRTLEDKKRSISKQINNLTQKYEKLKNQMSQLLTQKSNAKDWSQETYPWSKEIKEIVKTKFKFDNFQFKQLSAINATLSGKDVIVIMPTGGGKSLIYQLPAVYTKGVTLVISPLLSLITDQIKNLSNIGINATTINSNNSKAVSTNICNSLAKGTGNLKLLYVTPEYLSKSKRLMSYLQKCYERKALDRIAIDEVHCCSMWGHDFRPDYKNLHIFKNIFPDVPIIGVTATATEKVILETQELLGISGCLVLKAPYNRPNLVYKVLPKPSSLDEVGAFLEKLIRDKYQDQSGIIYTHSINDSVDLATELNKRGLKAGPYHAQMEADQKDKVYDRWLTKKYNIICATVAFGMGIDKPDVKFVIHHSLPKSMENYYQESGRAGRNGQSADCILLYSMKDVFRVSSMVATSSQNGLKYLYEIVQYCLEPTKCRRAMIAVHFNEEWDQSHCKKKCDNCSSPAEQKRIDILKFYQQLIKLINHRRDQFESNATALSLLDSWFQTGSGKKYRCDDIPVPRISRELGEYILMYLIINDYLKESLHFTLYTTISYVVKGNREPLDKILMPMKSDDTPSCLLKYCDNSSSKVSDDHSSSNNSPKKSSSSSSSSSSKKESKSNPESSKDKKRSHIETRHKDDSHGSSSKKIKNDSTVITID